MATIIAQSSPVPVEYITPLLSASTNANAVQVSGTGTTAKIFSVPNSSIPTGGTSKPAVTLSVPGSYRLEGQPFFVKADGIVYVHGISPTLALALYYIPNATFTGSTWQLAQSTAGSWTLAHTTGTPQSLTTATIYHWALTATVQGDTQSGLVDGSITYTIGANAPTAAAEFTNGLTLTTASLPVVVGGMGTEPPIVFGLGMTFGVSDAANVGQVNHFYIEG